MSEDFSSAAARHYNDSQLLFDERRLDNAAYLTGYVVECCLKALILHGGGSPRAYGHDLSALGGDALELAVLLSPGLRHYHVDTMAETRKKCDSWEPSLRYAKTGDVTEPDAARLREAAQDVFVRLLVPLILDGRVEGVH